MRKLKRTSIMMTIIMVMSLGFHSYACAMSVDNSIIGIVKQEQAKEVLAICEQKLARNELNDSSREERIEIIKETESRLLRAGVNAYILESENYDELTKELSINFDDLGLNSKYTYLIVDGDLGSVSGTRSSFSSPFTYTYNGTTYTMSYMTVTAADDPSFAKANYSNVLTSSSTVLIQNCLNTAIYAYLSNVSVYLGTVASICGLSVANFGTSQPSTMILNGGANWTRVFTMVYSPYDGMWYKGSCVEYAYVLSYMSGVYYNAQTNMMTPVPTNTSSTTKYSANYYNTTWRNQMAAIYFENMSGVNYDMVGNIPFYYGSNLKFTLYEDF